MVDFSLVLFVFFYFSSSFIYIVLRSNYKHELPYFSSITSLITHQKIWIALKIIPTFLAILGAILFKNPNNDSFLFIGIVIALVFCLFGDIAIESNFFQGMILSSFAQLFFIITFALSFTQNLIFIDVLYLSILLVIFAITGIYNFVFMRFLAKGGKLGKKYQSPVRIYSILLSLTFLTSCSIAYLMELGDLEMLIPFGAFLFVLSDSFIAIREFYSTHLRNSVAIIDRPISRATKPLLPNSWRPSRGLNSDCRTKHS